MNVFTILIIVFAVVSMINKSNKRKKEQQKRQQQEMRQALPRDDQPAQQAEPQYSGQPQGRFNLDELGIPLPMPPRKYRLDSPEQSEMEWNAERQFDPLRQFIGEMVPDGMPEGECDKDHHDAPVADRLEPMAWGSLSPIQSGVKEERQVIAPQVVVRAKATSAPQPEKPNPAAFQINRDSAINGLIWSEILRRPGRSIYAGNINRRR